MHPAARKDDPGDVTAQLVRLDRSHDPLVAPVEHDPRLVEVEQGEPDPVDRAARRAMDAVESGAIDPLPIISHTLPLAEAALGYELFDSRRARKVLLKP